MIQGCVGVKRSVVGLAMAAAFLGSAAGMAWAIGPIETVWDGMSGNFGQDRGIQVAQMLSVQTGRQEVLWNDEDVSTAEMNQSNQSYAAAPSQNEMRVGQKERTKDSVTSVSGKSRDRVIQVK